MTDCVQEDLLLRLRVRMQAAARSTVSLPRARLTSAFWYALHRQTPPRTAPRCVVVPLDVFMALRDAHPSSFPSPQVPLTQDPLSPLTLLYPDLATEKHSDAPKPAPKQEFFDVTFDELDLAPGEGESLAGIRAALHAAHGLAVAGSTLSVAAKKLWDPPAMWDVLPWTGAAAACCVDDSCVFRLVDRAPPRPPDAAELAAAESRARPAPQFPTLRDILREDEWADVVRRCESIESHADLPAPRRGFASSACTTEQQQQEQEHESGDRDEDGHQVIQ